MGIGTLKIETTAAFDALPVAGATAVVRDENGVPLSEATTDQNGATALLELPAPSAYHTLDPADPGPFYSTYTVSVTAPGYESVTVHGVQIFDMQQSILPVEMHPQARSPGAGRDIFIPENALQGSPAWLQVGGEETPAVGRRTVIIPETIVVHLGPPAGSARDLRVPFADYIKNVASSEIYPTWPQAALEANIHCQISFALNRVFTEWYPSRGYAFHITSSTSYDQCYIEGRNIFANISQLVDEIFNVYVQRQGYAEPYFTQYCNGTTVTCRGLSQWGTVPLAEQGLDAYGILLRYYPADIRLVSTDNIGGAAESYPGAPLRQGSGGESVRTMQGYLNRIRANYPLIPEIAVPDGVFGTATTAAVRAFQQIFDLESDGIVGKATWYKIISIYNAVKKLADLDSEGERVGLGAAPPTSVLRRGSRGGDVVQLQHILSFLAEFYSDLPDVVESSIFDDRTAAAVTAFQRKFGLPADGVVGPATWQKLYSVYRAAEATLPPAPAETRPYPGALLRHGARGEDVRYVQRCLGIVFRHCPGYTPLAEDGIFGDRTQAAVVAFQRSASLPPDGIVGPLTWNAMNAAVSQL